LFRVVFLVVVVCFIDCRLMMWVGVILLKVDLVAVVCRFIGVLMMLVSVFLVFVVGMVVFLVSCSCGEVLFGDISVIMLCRVSICLVVLFMR